VLRLLGRLRAQMTAGRVALMVLAVGALARSVQYAAKSSLWFDESLLWANLDRRSYSGLLDPLEFGQGAPPGFLLGQELITRTLGDGEYALRLMPFAMGLIALPLGLLVARRFVSPAAVPLALVPIALSPVLIEYSALTKQYSGDLTVALAILLATWFAATRRLTAAAMAGLALLGLAAMTLSHASLLVLAGVGAALLGAAALRRDMPRLARLAAVGAIWLIGAIVVYLINLRDLADVGGRVTTTGSDLVADNPFNPLEIANQVIDLFVNPLGLRREAALVGLVVAIVGAVAMARRGRGDALALLLGPLAVGIVLAVLRQYPLDSRFAFYVVPPLALLAAEGVACVWRGTRERVPALAPLLAVAILAGPLAGLLDLPTAREELRPALRYVVEHEEPGDIVFLHHPVQYPFAYYGPRAGFATAPYDPATDPPASTDDGWYEPLLGDSPPVLVGQQAPDLAAQVASLERLRGHDRVWIVFTHPQQRGGVLERSLLVTALDGWGTRLEQARWQGAIVYLYDLSGG
jgi:hypothetical protein